MYPNGIKSYRRTNVITADPGKLVIMCYEGAIDNLTIAKRMLIEKKYEEKCKALKKTQDIISELLCSLDFQKGGPVARNLESLYNYMTRKIVLADVNQDVSAIDEVLGMLGELLSAWKEVVAKPDRDVQLQTLEFGRDARSHAAGYLAI